ncbi:MAG: hypothetical protein H7836_12775 [Magnetococcus sp. YQC-3]
MSVELGLFQELVGFNFGSKLYADGRVYLCTSKQGVSPYDVYPDFIVTGVSSETALVYQNGNGGLTYDANETARPWIYQTFPGYFLDTGQPAVLRKSDYFSGCFDYPDAVTYNQNFIPGIFHHDNAYDYRWTLFDMGASRFSLRFRSYALNAAGTYAFAWTGSIIKRVQSALIFFVNGGPSYWHEISLVFFTTDKVSTLPVGSYYVLEFDDGKKINLRYGRIRTKNLDTGSKAILCNLTGYDDYSMYFNQFTDGEHARLTVRQGTPTVPYNTLY